MNPEDFIPRADVKLTETQDKCQHTYFKCPKCGKYKDNLFNEQQDKIDLLLDIIVDSIDKKTYPHHGYLKLFESAIIKKQQRKAMKKRYSKDRKTA